MHWESIRWLNPSPAEAGETFKKYLQNWHDAAPVRHQGFIQDVADSFGIDLLN